MSRPRGARPFQMKNNTLIHSTIDQRQVDISLPCCRQARKDGGFSAPRQAGCCSRQSVFPAGGQEPGRLPQKITLDGYQASHRAAREILGEHQRGKRTKIRSSKYLNNLIEQDHRSTKFRLGPMLGMKRFRSVSITIAGIELMHRIRKGQFTLGRLRIKDNRAPAVWNAVLAA